MRPILLALFALSLGVAAPAYAQSVELVPVVAGIPGKSTTVSTKGAAITTDEFVAAILDGDHYPMTATYAGVKALEECRSLSKLPDGSVIVYQRTGGNMLVGSRHYVIALKVKQKTDAVAEIEWNLVKHSFDGKTYSGPYASALNGKDAVWTPYNHGTWRYDRAAGTISYAVQSDPGGSIPDWAVGQGAVTAFPLELLKTRWGVVP